MVSVSQPWCAIVSAEKPFGIASQPLTAALVRPSTSCAAGSLSCGVLGCGGKSGCASKGGPAGAPDHFTGAAYAISLPASDTKSIVGMPASRGFFSQVAGRSWGSYGEVSVMSPTCLLRYFSPRRRGRAMPRAFSVSSSVSCRRDDRSRQALLALAAPPGRRSCSRSSRTARPGRSARSGRAGSAAGDLVGPVFGVLRGA